MNTPNPEHMRALLLNEQELAWERLRDAIHGGINTMWSIRASCEAAGIIRSVQLVGPCNPGVVPWPLLCGGVYAALVKMAGVDEVPTYEIKYPEAVYERLGKPETHLLAMIPVLNAIRKDRHWLLAEANKDYWKEYDEH